ncbi:MAG: ankyrin repeat domain-containing protein [Spirochaetia bacterium]|nr:ankyrin repeat domain-containing protein [Spirochaetia bacterium]
MKKLCLLLAIMMTAFPLVADENTRYSDGMTPLMKAVQNNESTEVVSDLLEAGADVHARADFRWTPLMFAAIWNENPEVITVLLEAGAEALVESSSGKKAIDFAKENESLKGTEAYWELNDASFE